MNKDRKYTILENLAYCAKTTREKYPWLLVYCVFIILINALLPVITAYLPKSVIEMIMEQKPLARLLLVTGAFTLGIAVLTGLQKYLDRMIYWNKSSCRFCDEITVFDEGRIVQKGTHTELLGDPKGQYFKLWNAQAQSMDGDSFSSRSDLYTLIIRIIAGMTAAATRTKSKDMSAGKIK